MSHKYEKQQLPTLLHTQDHSSKKRRIEEISESRTISTTMMPEDKEGLVDDSNITVSVKMRYF